MLRNFIGWVVLLFPNWLVVIVRPELYTFLVCNCIGKPYVKFEVIISTYPLRDLHSQKRPGMKGYIFENNVQSFKYKYVNSTRRNFDFAGRIFGSDGRMDECTYIGQNCVKFCSAWRDFNLSLGFLITFTSFDLFLNFFNGLVKVFSHSIRLTVFFKSMI